MSFRVEFVQKLHRTNLKMPVEYGIDHSTRLHYPGLCRFAQIQAILSVVVKHQVHVHMYAWNSLCIAISCW
jgi:hypothetical protein